MNALILARVSTKEQEEGHSIDAQISRLQEYCQRKNLKVLKVFKIIESSTQGDRKEFHQMIEFAKAQKEIVALVADAVDRIQRSFKESVMLDELIRAGKIELHFNREGMILNHNATSTDIMRWDFSVMTAKSYVLQLSDNVKRSLNHKIKNGEWIGKAPLGYINTPDPITSKKKITFDKEKSFLVRRLFEEYGLGGKSVREVAALAKKWGLAGYKGKPLTPGLVHVLLQNPFYYGAMRVKGEIFPAIHEPLISQELFDRCQGIRLGWKKKPFKYSDKPFVFRGLIKCAHCGCTITSDLKKGKYVYLFCTKYRGSCANHRIREEVVVDQVRDIFKSFQLPENVLEAIKNHLSASANSKKAYHEEAIARIRRDYDMIQKKLDALLDMRLDGSITRDEYDKKCMQLKERQYELNAELSAHTKADESFNITVSTLLDLASRAYDLFESSKVAQKRALINFTLSNLRLNGATLEYEKKKPFSLFGKTASCLDMLRGQDSNL